MRQWRQSWIVAAAIIGLVYAIVGITFAIPTTHAIAWRRGAWGVSILLFIGQCLHEHFVLHNSARRAAVHVAAAAALGALGLAIGANIHSLSTPSTPRHQSLLLASLVLWPVITAVPAFLVGFGINGLLSRFSRARAANGV